MTLNLFDRSPLRFVLSALILVVGMILAWRIILFVAVVAAIIGLFLFVRSQIRKYQTAHTRTRQKARGPEVEIFRDSKPHPERRVLMDVEEVDQ